MNNTEKQKNISESVLEKISSGHIAPKPKWEFLLKNSAFWILGVFTIFLGGLMLAASMFVFKNIRWDLYEATHENMLTFTVEFLPYLWIILFIGFLFFTKYLIGKTKKGYKYHLSVVGLIIIFASVSLGTTFYVWGIGEVVEKDLGSRLPFHMNIEKHNIQIWNNPDGGFLFGTVTSSGDRLILETPEKEIHNLITENVEDFILERLVSDYPIRVIGIQTDEGFFVCGILPDPRRIMMTEEVDEMMDFNFERKPMLVRNNKCEGVRPYQRLLTN